MSKKTLLPRPVICRHNLLLNELVEIPQGLTEGPRIPAPQLACPRSRVHSLVLHHILLSEVSTVSEVSREERFVDWTAAEFYNQNFSFTWSLLILLTCPCQII
ncbi:hypothetical protein ANANG_G00179770 [Anguilla anguilla]|uniref:Uncharacterized protein n=1 Tax=Anguilla anguilla TaxID=7936 RepID=A0A9D3M512_ANGAN|nr:hypothetical protein ANANG_G00179770 [Anguilla anguilla]